MGQMRNGGAITLDDEGDGHAALEAGDAQARADIVTPPIALGAMSNPSMKAA